MTEGYASILDVPKLKAHPLAELLPLKVPYSLNIDPSNVCNFRCTFCPTGYPRKLKV